MSDDKIILYGPVTGKSLFRLYPELANEPLFKAIPGDELLFAWYIGCKSSPIDPDWSDMTKYKTAASKAFTTNKDKRDKFGAGDITDDVKKAINEWAKMSPDARLVAKRMVQTIFHKYQEMVDVNVKEDFKYNDKDGAELIDWTGRKQYIDSMAKMSETLPSLIKQIEEGFGITEHKKTEDKLGSKSIDKFHQSKTSEN